MTMRCVKCALALLVASGAWAQEAVEAPGASANPPLAAQGAANGEAGQAGAAPPEQESVPSWWSDYLDESTEGDEAAASGEQGDTSPADNTDDPVVMILNALKWLAILLAIFIVGAILMKRFGQRARILAASDLAEHIGRLYLGERITLHFIRTGGRVLVIGVNPSSMTLLADLDASAYSEVPGAASAGAGASKGEAGGGNSTETARRFFEELKTQQGRMQGESAATVNPEDPDQEIASLRGDIARLQRMLRESSHESDR